LWAEVRRHPAPTRSKPTRSCGTPTRSERGAKEDRLRAQIFHAALNTKGSVHVNIEMNGFSARVGACGLVGLSSLAAVFYGCSSSSSALVTVPADAGTGTETGTPTPDSGSVSLIKQKVARTNLFADTSRGAPNADPNLLNPWGLAFNSTGTAWVADNHAGVLTLYEANQARPVPLVVQVPLPDENGNALYPALDSGMLSSPSGQIFNANAAEGDAGTAGVFKGDFFIVASEDGTISGWNPSLPDVTKAALRADKSVANAVFKGLAILPSRPPVLVAADFHNGAIDTFDANYALIAPVTGKWKDTTVPAGYAPFNIVVSGKEVFVAYAKQDAFMMADVAGLGNGAISVFDFTGTLVKSLVPQGGNGVLNSPWGMAFVGIGGWGSFAAGTLLVGNLGDGAIHAYDPTTGELIGTLVDSTGADLRMKGLWSLVWGPDAPDAGANPDQLFFTAGPNGQNDGLFGYLTTM
jgi:uncharacterized protein (TIGR03118 family)